MCIIKTCSWVLMTSWGWCPVKPDGGIFSSSPLHSSLTGFQWPIEMNRTRIGRHITSERRTCNRDINMKSDQTFHTHPQHSFHLHNISNVRSIREQCRIYSALWFEICSILCKKAMNLEIIVLTWLICGFQHSLWPIITPRNVFSYSLSTLFFLA